jgi:hypothetical protein
VHERRSEPRVGEMTAGAHELHARSRRTLASRPPRSYRRASHPSPRQCPRSCASSCACPHQARSLTPVPSSRG